MPEPIVVFTPKLIREAMERMPQEEILQLDEYAKRGKPDQFSERVTAWLIVHGYTNGKEEGRR